MEQPIISASMDRRRFIGLAAAAGMTLAAGGVLAGCSSQPRNAGARPALSQTVEAWDSYSTIYLGFPVWWYDAPQIIKTFMDSHDCTGKTVAVFSTSGGSSVESCMGSLRAIAPGATFTRSVTLDGDAVSSQLFQLDTWQAGLGP